MKRVILTGGTGFVGANLARRLLRDGHEVHLLVREGYRPWRINDILDDVRLHVVDLADEDTLVSVVRRIRADWVFHLAVYGAYASQQNVQQMIQTNILGTVNLVNACLVTGFEALVNTGSSSEYGFKDHPPHEQEALGPNSHYAVTKASATMFCRYTAQSQDVHMPTLRLYSVYGSYEEPTRLIPTVIVRGLHQELPPLVSASVARDYVYSEDVAEAYVRAASVPDQSRGAVYNVGTGIQTSLEEVVAQARRMLDIKVEPQWGSMPERAWDTHTWVANPDLIIRQLGWKPRYSFEEGFRRTVTWLRTHPSLLQFYEDKIQA